MDAIKVTELSVAYEENLVINHTSLAIPKGKITIIIGANGCGKSTLLKTIARIIKPKSGQIFVNGTDIRKQNPKVIAKEMAFLPQSPKCPESVTVRELVAFGRFPYQKAFGGMSRYDRKVVEWALEETGLIGFADRMVDELSGGQRQRAWIAMTLAQETDLILLDEPTTYLDMAHQLEVLQVLRDLNKKKHLTIVMVLHELNQACRFADHIIGMKSGNVICEGNPLEAITTETLREIYGIDATLIKSSQGYPVCTQFELQQRLHSCEIRG